MAGITATGFERKRTDEIKADIDTAVEGVFGPNIDLSLQSPDGQINQAFAESLGNLWEIAEASYNAFNIDAAVGVVLDNLVKLGNITRLAASPSIVTLTCFGTDTTVIPTGSLVESTSGDQFETVADATIGSTTPGEVDVSAQSVETGVIVAAAGTITTIVTAVTGWTSVTNAADAAEGREEETDAELRLRYKSSTAIASENQPDSIIGAVRQVDGVTSAQFFENFSKVTVGGVPASAFEVIVLGGTDEDIAQVIFEKKSAGIQPYGTTIVAVEDSDGNSYDIGLTRPSDVTIYIEVNLTTDTDYPANGDDLIKQALLDYFSDNLTPGDDVINSRLYTPVNTVAGHTIDSLLADTITPPVSSADIIIDVDEIADLQLANIVVNS